MTGNKNEIFFLSASDRVNYGDLLFPIIFRKFLEENNLNVEFNNYALIESDLTYFQALKTNSYKQFLKDVKNKEGKIVIGGGEVFFANFNTLYSFINPGFSKLKKIKLFNFFNRKFKFADYILSGKKVKIPFCPSIAELGNKEVSIYYSSVGGVFPSYEVNSLNNHATECLKDASIISVRDQRTSDSLLKMGIKSKLVPDSALLVSDYFSEKDLESKANIKNLPFEKFIFVQIGINKAPSNVKKFVDDLGRLSKILKMKIILCPIGKAPEHEDQIILKELNRINADFHFVDPQSIFDILYLISKAQIYLGTSLHGMITAQSYNTVFIGLNPYIKKLESYMETWIDENMKCLDFNHLERVPEIFENWDYDKIIEINTYQKQLIRKNLESILND